MTEAHISRRNFLKLASEAILTGITPFEIATEPRTRRPVESAVDNTPDNFKPYLRYLRDHPEDIMQDTDWNHPIEAGIGYVTLYGDEAGVVTSTANAEHSFYSPLGLASHEGDVKETRKKILEKVVGIQSHLSPEEALQSGQVIGYAALRSPESEGRKYLVWRSDTPDAEPKFLGVIQAVDCAAEVHWNKSFKHHTYSQELWERNGLPSKKDSRYKGKFIRWIGEVSKLFQRHLPLGAAPNADYLDAGRPGVVLVSEDRFRQIIEHGWSPDNPLPAVSTPD